ncbi:MAG: hypothetical protein WCO23_02960 [bacterium]
MRSYLHEELIIVVSSQTLLKEVSIVCENSLWLTVDTSDPKNVNDPNIRVIVTIPTDAIKEGVNFVSLTIVPESDSKADCDKMLSINHCVEGKWEPTITFPPWLLRGVINQCREMSKLPFLTGKELDERFPMTEPSPVTEEMLSQYTREFGKFMLSHEGKEYWILFSTKNLTEWGEEATFEIVWVPRALP